MKVLLIKVINNLFGEFIDCALGIGPEEAVQLGADYKLYGGHTIGVWIFIGFSLLVCILCITSKKFRDTFF